MTGVVEECQAVDGVHKFREIGLEYKLLGNISGKRFIIEGLKRKGGSVCRRNVSGLRSIEMREG